MRYPGESATGDTPGRRGSPSGRSAPARPGPGATDQPAPSDPSVFAPGYSTGRAGGRVSGRAAARGGDGHYGSTGGAANKGPIRGFPPAPGQPPPLYPPGQFSAWNRTPRSGGDALEGASPASGAWSTLSSTGGSVATAPPRADTTGRGYPGLDDPDLGHADLGRTDLGQTNLGQTNLGQTDLGTTGLGTGGLSPDGLGPDELSPAGRNTADPGLGSRGGTGPGRSARGDAYAGYADRGYADQRPADAGYSDRGYSDTGYGDPGYDEPGYSALAVSDPAADATSTQTWGAVDSSATTNGWDSQDPGGWSSPATSGWDSQDPGGWDSPGGWSDPSGPGTDPRSAARPYTDPLSPHTDPLSHHTDPLQMYPRTDAHQALAPHTDPLQMYPRTDPLSPHADPLQMYPGTDPDQVLAPRSGPQRVPLPRTEPGMLPGAGEAAGFAAADLAAGGGPQAPGLPGGATVPHPGWTHDGEDGAAPAWELDAGPDHAGSSPDLRTGPRPRAGGGRRRGREPRSARATGPDARPTAPPGPGPRSRARAHAQKRPGVTMVASVLAVLVVVGAGGYLWFSTRSSPTAAVASPAATPGTSPSAAASSSTLPGPWGDIVSRASDPAPLTLSELFPAEFTNGAAIYAKTVQQARPRCPGALIGSHLISAVNKAKCSQAMRASYLSSDQTMMGTIGVLNLNTAAAAAKAGKAAGPSEFIAQLAGKTGPTKKLTKGTGIEAAEVKGHYLVLVWAEYSNLKAPGSAARRQNLETFISLLIQRTANVSLATRMVTGKPPA
ncbi:MAG TPA: hypothetical protein VGJ50_14385 [Streptosporangiaceae bacterium]